MTIDLEWEMYELPKETDEPAEGEAAEQDISGDEFMSMMEEVL